MGESAVHVDFNQEWINIFDKCNQSHNSRLVQTRLLRFYSNNYAIILKYLQAFISHKPTLQVIMLNKVRKEIQIVLMLSFLLGTSEFLSGFYSNIKPTFLIVQIPTLIAYNFVLHILMVGIIFLISSLLLKILKVFLRWFPVAINFNASIVKIALTLSFFLFANYWVRYPANYSLTQYFLFCLGIIGILVYLSHIIYKKFRRLAKILIYGYASALFITCCALITWSIYARVTEQPFKGNYTTKFPNIVYIVIDTLRADALSCYGNKKIATPAIDTLASDGILFENAYSSSSWTIPGTTTLLTSQDPLSLRMTHFSSIMPEEATLAGEALKEKGYMTAAIIGNVLVNEKVGFNQGFEYFDWDANVFYDSFVGVMLFNSTLKFLKKWRVRETEFFPVLDFSSPYFISYEINSYRDASDITSNAVKLIEKLSSSSFFLYLQYFDPHTPNFKHPVGSLFNLEANFTIGEFCTVENKDKFLDLYLSEVEYADKHIGYLINNLKNKGIYDNTIIILTSDHGEQFMEHGYHGHPISLYNGELRVPLIIKGIENNRGVKFSPPTSIIDILPTVFDMLKINTPESFQGKSLTSFINKTAGKTKNDYVSGVLVPTDDSNDPKFRYALMKDNYKYIISSRIDVKNPIKAGKEELYDLQTDKDEKNNIASENPEVIAKFRKVLSKQIKKIPKPGDIKEKPLDRSQHKLLKALGYIQ